PALSPDTRSSPIIWAASAVGGPDAGPPPSVPRVQANPRSGYAAAYSASAEFSTRSDSIADVSRALIVTCCIAGTARVRSISRTGIVQTARTPQTIRMILTGFDMGSFRAALSVWCGFDETIHEMVPAFFG